jgi:SOS regulatory protein LexA
MINRTGGVSVSDLGELLKKLRGKKSLREASKLSGLSYSYISSLEKGEHPKTKANIQASPESLKALSKAYNYSYTDLMQAAGYIDTENMKKRSEETIQKYLDKMRNEETSSEPIMGNLVSIPVIGEIKAGYDMLADQNIIAYELTNRRDLEEGETYFYLLVKGDSMINAGIREGYRVLVRKQSFIEDGKIGVVIVNGDEATLKRIYFNDTTVTLVAENPKVPPKTYPIDEVFIQGQVIKFEGDV